MDEFMRLAYQNLPGNQRVQMDVEALPSWQWPGSDTAGAL
jgi:hypothetical protein